MKIEERGRAKYRPLKDYDIEQVKNLLIEKIQEEQENTHGLPEEDTEANINFNPNKLNLVSLFSGCGGLDLGAELSGLDATIGNTATNNILSSRESFDRDRNQSVFHTIYSVDMFKEANQTYRLNFPQTVIQNQKIFAKLKLSQNAISY